MAIDSSGLFSDSQKVDIRRFCGYPANGADGTDANAWRFFQPYGYLEYRMSNLAPAEAAVVLQYLSTLSVLESNIPGAAENLDTENAASWTHNANEVKDRTELFDAWRRRLCGFLGVAPGPSLNTGEVRLVV